MPTDNILDFVKSATPTSEKVGVFDVNVPTRKTPTQEARLRKAGEDVVNMDLITPTESTYLGDPAKYEKYGVILNPLDDDLDRQRAKNQGAGEQFVNMLGQALGGELIGGTLEGFGAIGDVLSGAAFKEGDDRDYQNWLTQFGSSIRENIQEAAPIYQLDPEAQLAFGDFGYIMNRMPSVISSLSLLLPVAGTAKGISLVGRATGATRGLNKVGRAVQAAAQTGKYGSIAQAVTTPMRLRQAGILSQQGLSAIGMRIGENYRESADTYNTIKDEALNYFNTLSDEDYHKLVLENKYLGDIDLNDKDAVASRIASKAAGRSFAINFGNVVWDFIQLRALSGAWKNAQSRGASFAQREANRTGAATLGMTAEAAAVATTKSIKQKVADNIFRIAGGTKAALIAELSEGAEESLNFVAGEEGKLYGRYLMGEDSKYGETDWADRAAEYITNPELWDSAVWGIIGGITFQGLGSGFNKIKDKISGNDEAAPNIRMAEITGRQSKYEALQRHMQLIEAGYNPFSVQLDEQGNEVLGTDGKPIYDKIESEAQRESLREAVNSDHITDLALDAIMVGNYGLLKEYVNDANIKGRLIEMGISTEEDYDVYNSMINNKMDEVLNSFKNYSSLFNSANVTDHTISMAIANNIANDNLTDRANTRISDLSAANDNLAMASPEIRSYRSSQDLDSNIKSWILKAIITDLNERITNLEKSQNDPVSLAQNKKTLSSVQKLHRDYVSKLPALDEYAGMTYEQINAELEKDMAANKNIGIESYYKTMSEVEVNIFGNDISSDYVTNLISMLEHEIQLDKIGKRKINTSKELEEHEKKIQESAEKAAKMQEDIARSTVRTILAGENGDEFRKALLGDDTANLTDEEKRIADTTKKVLVNKLKDKYEAFINDEVERADRAKPPVEAESVEVTEEETEAVLVDANKTKVEEIDKPAETHASEPDIVRDMKADSQRLTLTEDGRFYQDTDGNLYARTTSIINAVEGAERFDPTSEWGLPSAAIGTMVDRIIRDNIASGEIKIENLDLYSDELILSGVYPVVIPIGAIQFIPIAGTTDVIGINRTTGDLVVLDIKSQRTQYAPGSSANTARLNKYAKQLSMYKHMIESKYGITVNKLLVIPIGVSYPAPNRANVYTLDEQGRLLLNGKLFILDDVKYLEPQEVNAIDITTEYDLLTDEERNITISGEEAVKRGLIDDTNKERYAKLAKRSTEELFGKKEVPEVKAEATVAKKRGHPKKVTKVEEANVKSSVEKIKDEEAAKEVIDKAKQLASDNIPQLSIEEILSQGVKVNKPFTYKGVTFHTVEIISMSDVTLIKAEDADGNEIDLTTKQVSYLIASGHISLLSTGGLTEANVEIPTGLNSIETDDMTAAIGAFGSAKTLKEFIGKVGAQFGTKYSTEQLTSFYNAMINERESGISEDSFNQFQTRFDNMSNLVKTYAKAVGRPDINGKTIISIEDFTRFLYDGLGSKDTHQLLKEFKGLLSYMQDAGIILLTDNENIANNTPSELVKLATTPKIKTLTKEQRELSRGNRLQVRLNTIATDKSLKTDEALDEYKRIMDIKNGDELTLELVDGNIHVFSNGVDIGVMPTVAVNSDGSYTTVNENWNYVTRIKSDGSNNYESDFINELIDILNSPEGDNLNFLANMERFKVAAYNKDAVETKDTMTNLKNNPVFKSLLDKYAADTESQGATFTLINHINKIFGYNLNLSPTTQGFIIAETLEDWMNKLGDSYNATNALAKNIGNDRVRAVAQDVTSGKLIKTRGKYGNIVDRVSEAGSDNYNLSIVARDGNVYEQGKSETPTESNRQDKGTIQIHTKDSNGNKIRVHLFRNTLTGNMTKSNPIIDSIRNSITNQIDSAIDNFLTGNYEESNRILAGLSNYIGDGKLLYGWAVKRSANGYILGNVSGYQITFNTSGRYAGLLVDQQNRANHQNIQSSTPPKFINNMKARAAKSLAELSFNINIGGIKNMFTPNTNFDRDGNIGNDANGRFFITLPTGERLDFDNYGDFLINSDILVTDIDAVRDKDGNIVSNFAPSGEGVGYDKNLYIGLEIEPISSKPAQVVPTVDLNESARTLISKGTKFRELANNYGITDYNSILDALDLLNVNIATDISSNRGRPNTNATFNAATNTISIFNKWLELSNDEKVRKLIHEALHYYIRELPNYQTLETEFNTIYDKFAQAVEAETNEFRKQRMQLYLGNKNRSVNVEEFIVEALTSKELIGYLATIPSEVTAEGKAGDSLFKKIMDLMVELLQSVYNITDRTLLTEVQNAFARYSETVSPGVAGEVISDDSTKPPVEEAETAAPVTTNEELFDFSTKLNEDLDDYIDDDYVVESRITEESQHITPSMRSFNNRLTRLEREQFETMDKKELINFVCK